MAAVTLTTKNEGGQREHDGTFVYLFTHKKNKKKGTRNRRFRIPLRRQLQTRWPPSPKQEKTTAGHGRISSSRRTSKKKKKKKKTDVSESLLDANHKEDGRRSLNNKERR